MKHKPASKKRATTGAKRTAAGPAAKRKAPAKPVAKPVVPKPISLDGVLRDFVEAMDVINDDNGGVTDTEVREVLADIVIARLVERRADAPIPTAFQMMVGSAMSPEFDARVRAVVSELITSYERHPHWRGAATDAERKALIARDDVQSRRGNAYWLYLGDWS